ncbi:MAG: N-acetyltransferase [Inquilinus sp.]|nr:N-acetyltransferase [Inquilinus sp.]
MVAAIYRHHVRHGTASFELEPPDEREIARRHGEVAGIGMPYLVAELAGEVAGFAYAAPFRPRPAYDGTVEDSVYVAPACQGRGIGRALLGELIARSTALGKRQMIAAIGDGANAGSIALHEALGFRHAGTLRSVGFKHGQWRDVVLMQRPLGDGDTTLAKSPE